MTSTWTTVRRRFAAMIDRLRLGAADVDAVTAAGLRRVHWDHRSAGHVVGARSPEVVLLAHGPAAGGRAVALPPVALPPVALPPVALPPLALPPVDLPTVELPTVDLPAAAPRAPRPGAAGDAAQRPGR